MACTFPGIRMITKESMYFFADELEKQSNFFTNILKARRAGGASSRTPKPSPAYKKWQKKKKREKAIRDNWARAD